ncbi:hypothetical protein KAI46_03005 [bacterium]|nr:hypothetical protein [bacterium]
MKILFIIIAIIIVVGFIWKKILLNKLAPTWRELVGTFPGGKEDANELKQVVEQFMIPDKISPHLFLTNWNALASGDPTNSSGTQSLRQYLIPFNRPSGYPIWFLATYPDVAQWVAQSVKFDEKFATKMIDDYVPSNNEYFNHGQLRKSINTYIQKNGKLECSL